MVHNAYALLAHTWFKIYMHIRYIHRSTTNERWMNGWRSIKGRMQGVKWFKCKSIVDEYQSVFGLWRVCVCVCLSKCMCVVPSESIVFEITLWTTIIVRVCLRHQNRKYECSTQTDRRHSNYSWNGHCECNSSWLRWKIHFCSTLNLMCVDNTKFDFISFNICFGLANLWVCDCVALVVNFSPWKFNFKVMSWQFDSIWATMRTKFHKTYCFSLWKSIR